MGYRTLESRHDILEARRRLAQILKPALPILVRRLIGYPSGDIPNAPARFERAGAQDVLWWHRFPSEGGGVEVNLFGLNDTREHGGMNISFQFNFPLDGILRNQGGVFITDGEALVLAHRGIMTRRHRVPREPLLHQLRHRAIEVEDGRQVSTVLVIAPLDAPSLIEDLKAFGREARTAVERAVSGVAAPLRADPSTTFGLPSATLRDYFDEFFGKRSAGGGIPKGAVAECYHGAVVKALETELRAQGKSKKSGHVDLAVQRGHELLIFEVKTSTSAGAVYTGLGQLLYHGEAQRHTGKRVVRCLVLPKRPEAQAAALISRALDVKFVAFERQPDGTYSFDGLKRL